MNKYEGMSYQPNCSCYPLATEPNPNCWVHGYPNPAQCPYCGQFRGYLSACKRCGCSYGLVLPLQGVRVEEIFVDELNESI